MPIRLNGIPRGLSFHEATSYKLLPPATSTTTQLPAAVPSPVSLFPSPLGGSPQRCPGRLRQQGRFDVTARKRQDERRSLTQRARRREIAAHGTRELAADREAQAGAGRRA